MLQSGPVLGRFDRLDQIGPRTLRGPALVGVPFCTVRYKIGERPKVEPVHNIYESFLFSFESGLG